jgi:PQQ-like domain
VKWSLNKHWSNLGSPVVGDEGTVYLGSFDGNLYAIHPDASEKWAFSTGETILGTASLVCAHQQRKEEVAIPREWRQPGRDRLRRNSVPVLRSGSGRRLGDLTQGHGVVESAAAARLSVG